MSHYTKMAIDFGTSNTIVAFWDEERGDVVLHHVPDVTLPFRFRQDGQEKEVPYIPSLIYYEDRFTNYIGFQVIEKALENSRGAFRWIKAYIQQERNMMYPLSDGTQVDYFRAGRDFLEKVLAFSTQSGYVDLASCEVAFTVPVEAFEHYSDWLADTCLELGVKRYRFIDESSACIFGYDTHLQPGDTFLIFDFGGGTLDVSMVRMEEQVEGGKGCRVIGKAGCRLGGRTIDGWLYDDMLKRARIDPLDARKASALFMLQVEKVKEHLTSHSSCAYDIRHGPTGLRLKGTYQRGELEDLMEEKGLFHHVHETVERALKQAAERGYEKGDIKECLLVGGSSLIPSIRRQVRTIFGDKVRFFRPYDAVARGACRFLTSDVEALYDYIQHDYAIKGYDSRKGEHVFIPLVPKGTRYPTREDFKRMTLKATRNGQRFFGIDIYEVAEKESVPTGAGEIVFDLNGGAVFETGLSGGRAGTEFWMNEDNPTFIEADPPAERGAPRFSVSFRVDSQKRLLITVRDILTQRLLFEDYPVVKLR